MDSDEPATRTIDVTAENARSFGIKSSVTLAIRKLNLAVGAALPRARADYLSHAVEFAVGSVMTAWDWPTAKRSKLWASLFGELRPRLDPEVMAWAERVEQMDPDSVTDLVSTAEGNIRAIIQLAEEVPPQGWPIRPDPVGWDGLSDRERAFLADAAARARERAPGSALWLFGSRANGTADDCSDYDLLLVVPDGTTEPNRGQAKDEVVSLAESLRIDADMNVTDIAQFMDPFAHEKAVLLLGARVWGFPIGVDGVYCSS